MSRLNVINAASNAVYILFGIAAAPAGPHGLTFCAAMIFLGIGSGLWHYRPERNDWRRLDEVGMYAVGIALGVLWAGGPWWVALPLWAAAYYVSPRADSFFVVPLLVAFVLGAMLGAGEALAAGMVAVIFGLGFYVRQMDADGKGKWHHLWHLLTALACWLAFATYA